MSKKLLSLFLILFCLFTFGVTSRYALYVKSIPKATPIPDSTPAPIENEEDIVQAEIIYYDKTWFDNEILNYNDVFLPISSANQSYLTETVFVGDSNTEGLANFYHLPSDNVIGKHSMAIGGVTSGKYHIIVEDNPDTEEDETQYITMLTALANKQPKRIIFNFGTNNAGKGASAASFIKTYKSTLTQIQAVCPNTQIVVASVLPVCLERYNLNLRQNIIDEFNIELANMCREMGLGFLNYTEVFKDSETGYANSNYFSSDGIHLNGDGYRLLLDYANNHQYN